MNELKRIILVEDNPADAELTGLVLSKYKHPVKLLHFVSGRSLLDFMNTSKEFPQGVILLDLNMPEIHGKEILRLLRANEKWQYVPVVVFTSSGSMEDIKTCYELGANAFVTKPFNIDQFEETLNSIINFWVRVNSQPQFEKSSITGSIS